MMNTSVCVSSFSTPIASNSSSKRRKCFYFSRIQRRSRLLTLCYKHELQPEDLKQTSERWWGTVVILQQGEVYCVLNVPFLACGTLRGETPQCFL